MSHCLTPIAAQFVSMASTARTRLAWHRRRFRL